MENIKTIKTVVESDIYKSEVAYAQEGVSCSITPKSMNIKVFEGGKAPEYKNGNWMDTYVRAVGVLDKNDVGAEIHFDDADIQWFTKPDDIVFYGEGDVLICKLGFALELLPKHELWLVPRSSTFRKTGLILTNSKGIGDDTFIGDGDEYSVMMLATRDNSINIGDRLVQIRVAEAMGDKYSFNVVDSLNNANRGGFGTTGK